MSFSLARIIETFCIFPEFFLTLYVNVSVLNYCSGGHDSMSISGILLSACRLGEETSEKGVEEIGSYSSVITVF
jgi:hypothetical protein